MKRSPLRGVRYNPTFSLSRTTSCQGSPRVVRFELGCLLLADLLDCPVQPCPVRDVLARTDLPSLAAGASLSASVASHGVKLFLYG